MAGDVVLEARGLVKDYRRDRAVDDVSLTVHAGERVALLGPNGAGKTTTLLMVLGVVSPDQGDVAICGFDLGKRRRRAAKARNAPQGRSATRLFPPWPKRNANSFSKRSNGPATTKPKPLGNWGSTSKRFATSCERMGFLGNADRRFR